MSKNYIKLGKRILSKGRHRDNRTDTDTIAKFGESIRFDLSGGFPVITTKKMEPLKAIFELLWFIRGPEDGVNMNTGWLEYNGVKFWKPWADEEGSIGPCYGSMLRGMFKNELGENIDQLSILMEGLKNNPNSRRHVVSLWHPAYLPNEGNHPKDNPALGKGSLAPCFWNYTFDIDNSNNKKVVNLHVQSRSSDFGIGLPFNIVEFSAFVHMVADQIGGEVGELYISITNAHIYINHVEELKKQFDRKPYPKAKLELRKGVKSIFDYKIEDFVITGYKHHEAIKLEPAI